MKCECWTLHALNCRSFNYAAEGEGHQTQMMNDNIKMSVSMSTSTIFFFAFIPVECFAPLQVHY